MTYEEFNIALAKNTAGAIKPPQILQLSGISNAEELKALGIDVVAGVGKNPHSHLLATVMHDTRQPVTAPSYQRLI
ncbi:GMC family oxidoreductase N-terminal domain-containing protein [Hymenobacter terricola]|uniref:GMC family oxidoreductase N-terminal domain-containing protein n=1 Tax=Hymenobacter terricola TaxID=2819236 RepID=UPI001B307433|nr:GMC family oxidoreductase N-terminal domain-containing protein [Hymenobacter terricola]